MTDDGGLSVAAWGFDGGFAASKFTAAPLPAGHVARARLLLELDEARARPLTLLSGPAGSGKSVLLAGWSASLGAPGPAWLTLDEQDNDPRRFWGGVLAACAVAVPVDVDRTSALAALGAAPRDGLGLLVVDGVQELHDPVARKALEALVDQPPPWLHLVLAGRARPALPLHQYRARDRLLEVEARDLAFTRSEVADLAVAAGLQLADGQVDRIVERTEGWAVGVRLAVAGALRSSDPDAYLVGFDGTDPHVADHLRREVLDDLADELAAVLTALAPFDQVDAGLFRAVTGREDGASTLRVLADAHVFVTEQGDRSGTYRVHRMVRELLCRDLEAAQPGAIATAHEQAAHWHEGRGADWAAVEEWSRAGRHDRAARLVDAHFPQLYDSVSRGVIMDWSGKGSIPSGDDPGALLDHATRLAVGYADAECLDVLNRVESALSVEPDDASITRAMALRGLVRYFQGQLPAAGALMEEVANRVRAADPDVRARLVEKLVVRHAELWATLSSTAMERFDDAHRSVERYSRTVVADPMGDRFRRSVLASLAVAEGRVDEGARLASDVVDELTDVGDAHYVALIALSTHGRALLERDELGRAEAQLERASAVCAPRPWAPPYIAAQLDLASVRFARGDRDEALALVARARAGAEPGLSPAMAGWIDERYTALMLRSGSIDAAGQSARRLPTNPSALLLLAQVLLAGADAEAADALLVSLPVGTPRQSLGVAIAHAQAAWAGQRFHEARQIFATAVETASGLGLVRTLAECGPQVEPLLSRIPDRSDGFVARVRTAAQREVTMVAEVRAVASDLSHRELEILGYLPTTMTNREIADDVFISANTMKTHVAHIYRKLGATSREDAVARARALGLLL